MRKKQTTDAIQASPPPPGNTQDFGPAFWLTLKQEYITSDGQISLAALAEKHGVSATTVEHRSAAEKWTQERATFWQQVDSDTRARLRRNIVDEREKLLRRIISATIKVTQPILSGEVQPNSLEGCASALASLTRSFQVLTESMMPAADGNPEDENLLMQHMTPEAFSHMLVREGLLRNGTIVIRPSIDNPDAPDGGAVVVDNPRRLPPARPVD